jgi:ABC-2 type transport system ATP-binding protein
MDAVSTHGLTKDFRTGFWKSARQRALDGLSISVPGGGIFGLLGPNGAGKSTALKLLIGVLKPSAGSASVLGGRVGSMDVHRRIGFLPENPTFYDRLTGEELLTAFAGLFGYTGADCRLRAARALDRVGIGAERTRPLRQYSKGMIQRIGFAQALVNDPELLLLDEPMSGLDPIGRRQIRALVATLAAEGRTILLSSHILADAEELCDHVAILSRGRLVLSERTSDLTSDYEGWRLTFHRGRVTPEALTRWPAEMLDNGRFAVLIKGGERPEPVVSALATAGADLESVIPLRESLEGVFVRVLGEERVGDDGMGRTGAAT